jgi:uncharacterized repeat protein (TIGR03837 family)
MNINSIDIFCQIIDNFGDAGVVYRFAKEFKTAHPQCIVRVFIDDLTTLKSILPEIDPLKTIQQSESITYLCSQSIDTSFINSLDIADILVEAFACQIPESIMNAALFHSKLIINLEYLSAEPWVEGYHLKESLLPKGTVKKFFFMPGFTSATGGLILNSQLQAEKNQLKIDRFAYLNSTLKSIDRTFHIENVEQALFGTIFTYQRGFDNLLNELQSIDKEVILLVFGQKSQNSIISALKRLGIPQPHNMSFYFKNIKIKFSPFLDQHRYDTLLCCTNFNFVRGEDSLARAACSGRPFIWNAYLQDNKYQKVKVLALLDVLKPYFDDISIFNSFSELHLKFNDCHKEEQIQSTDEHYDSFFHDLNKIEHAMSKFSYFIDQNCNLVVKFSDFLKQFKN